MVCPSVVFYERLENIAPPSDAPDRSIDIIAVHHYIKYIIYYSRLENKKEDGIGRVDAFCPQYHIISLYFP